MTPVSRRRAAKLTALAVAGPPALALLGAALGLLAANVEAWRRGRRQRAIRSFGL